MLCFFYSVDKSEIILLKVSTIILIVTITRVNPTVKDSVIPTIIAHPRLLVVLSGHGKNVAS